MTAARWKEPHHAMAPRDRKIEALQASLRDERCFLEYRSPNGPRSGIRKILAAMAGASTEDIAAAEPVRSRIHQASAIEPQESPITETAWLIRKIQKSRFFPAISPIVTGRSGSRPCPMARRLSERIGRARAVRPEK